MNITEVEDIIRDLLGFLREEIDGDTRLNTKIESTYRDDTANPQKIIDADERYRISNIMPEKITMNRWVNIDFEQTTEITNNFVLRAIDYALRLSIVDKSKADHNTFYRMARYNKALKLCIDEWIETRSNTRGVQEIVILATDIIERVELVDNKIKALQSSITLGITIV